MKHLKPYKIFESVDDSILLEMEDRLKDLEDMGYEINVAAEDFGECTGYTVYIGNRTKDGKGKKFSYDSIKEHLEHLENFMKAHTRFMASGYSMKLKRGFYYTMTSSVILQFVPTWYLPFA